MANTGTLHRKTRQPSIAWHPQSEIDLITTPARWVPPQGGIRNQGGARDRI
jgi:hypothetical protein